MATRKKKSRCVRGSYNRKIDDDDDICEGLTGSISNWVVGWVRWRRYAIAFVGGW